jgi:hypothetical protein
MVRYNNFFLFNEFVCTMGFFWYEWARLKRECFKDECQKKSNLHKNELNTTFFLFDDPFKGSKSLKIFKINLTFRFDKL